MKADIAYWALSASEQSRLRSKREAALNELRGVGAFAVIYSGEAPAAPAGRFMAGAWFRDLTGFNESKAALLLDGLTGEALLFCSPRDRQEQIWHGYRLGADRAEEALGLAGRDWGELDALIDQRLALGRSLCVDGSSVGEPERRLQERLWRARAGGNGACAPSALAALDFSALCAGLRLIKDGREIERARQSARLASLGHIAAMEALFRFMASERRAPGSAYPSPGPASQPDWAALKGSPMAFALAASGQRPALTERSLEAAFMGAILSFGADGPAYPPIVAAGENALCLHWNENRRAIVHSDWVLCDMGASYQGFCSDITRSYPANGEFSGLRSAVYEALLQAQKSALDACREGADWGAPAQAAQSSLIESLLGLGLLREGWAVKPQNAPLDWDWRPAALKRLMPHALSHHLGRATHDIGHARLGGPKPGQALADLPGQRLRPGMILAIEPGLYFDERLAGLPEELAGFGLRVEDDALIRPGKAPPEVLSALCPKEPRDIRAIAKACGL